MVMRNQVRMKVVMRFDYKSFIKGYYKKFVFYK